MHDDRTLVEARLKRVLDERIRPAVYPESVPLEVAVWHAPGEPVPVAEGLAAAVPRRSRSATGGARPGAPAGSASPAPCPSEWAGRTVEAVLDLGFDENMPGFQCEGLVYRPDGTPVKGLNPRNQWVRDRRPAAGGEEVRLHVEAASNPVILDYHPFLPTQLGDKETAGQRAAVPLDPDGPGRLRRDGLAAGPGPRGARRADARAARGVRPPLTRSCARSSAPWTRSTCRTSPAPPAAARAAARRRPRRRPRVPTAHRISAVGHAHIDSAWLWPLRETVRKVARTVVQRDRAAGRRARTSSSPCPRPSSTPGSRSTGPRCGREVKKAVADGQFVPVGGMWVESDTNMPGGEAMARQFVHGKRFFLDEFGVETEEVWLPDTFGYTAGLPQIIKAAGVQVVPHPEDLLEPDQQVPAPHLLVGGHRRHPDLHPLPARRHLQLLDAAAARSRTPRATSRTRAAPGTRSRPFGWGDGGGGPTREMLAKAARLRDLEGSATVDVGDARRRSSPRPRPSTRDPPVWVGELYLELHRATLTSQAKTKQGNRRSEHLLREAELWAATAAVRDRLRLPVRASWTGSGRRCCCTSSTTSCPAPRSPGCTARRGRPTRAVAEELDGDHRRRAARAGRAPAGGGERGLQRRAARPRRRRRPAAPRAGARRGRRRPLAARRAAAASSSTTAWCGWRSTSGAWSSPCTTSSADRETVAPGAGGQPAPAAPRLPQQWDAWDVDEFYRNTVTDLTDADEVTPPATSTARRCGSSARFGASTGHPGADPGRRAPSGSTSTPRSTGTRRRSSSRLAFPLDVHAERYAVGDPVRPRLPAHPHQHQLGGGQVRGLRPPLRARRRARLGRRAGQRLDLRPRRDPRPCGRTAGTTTTVRLSLLRAPRFPDPETDQGVHRFRHALVPGATIGDAVREGYGSTCPSAACPVTPRSRRW